MVVLYTFSSTPAGTTIGLKDSEWGQMGVTMMAGTEGWIIDAPAAPAYAVLPVGVEMISPSPCKTKNSIKIAISYEVQSKNLMPDCS